MADTLNLVYLNKHTLEKYTKPHLLCLGFKKKKSKLQLDFRKQQQQNSTSHQNTPLIIDRSGRVCEASRFVAERYGHGS